MDKIKLKMSLAAIGTGFLLSFVTINSNAQVAYPGFLNNGTWHNWSGVYWGIYFGAGSGNANTTFQRKDVFKTLDIIVDDDALITESSLDTTQSSGKFSGDITGSKADLFVGFNFNPYCTNFVFGGQIEGTIFSDISVKTHGKDKSVTHSIDTFTDSDIGFTIVDASVATDNETIDYLDELRSMFSFVIRAGYLITPSTLIYGLLGLTEGHFVKPGPIAPETALDDFFGDDDTIDNFGGKRNLWQQGWTYGAGLEYQLTCNWFIRAEFRRMHFNIGRSQFANRSLSVTDEGSMFLVNDSFNRHTNTEVNFNQGQIGLVYRF